MNSNPIWDLVDLLPGRKSIGNKWILKIKHKTDESIDRYKARLVLKKRELITKIHSRQL